MKNYQTFFISLSMIRFSLRGKFAKQVKRRIGDSDNNNRVLTVNQTVRYLQAIGQNTLATQLENSFEALGNSIKVNRFTNRTDAIDINEFVKFYNNNVIENNNHRTVAVSAL